MKRALTHSALALAFLFSTSAPALALTAQEECSIGQVAAAGKYAQCLMKEQARILGGYVPPAFGNRCGTKFTRRWHQVQKRVGSDLCIRSWSDDDIAQLMMRDSLQATVGYLAGPRFEASGSGTVVDHDSGLEWLMSDTLGGATDKSQSYTWTDLGDADYTDPDGSMFMELLASANEAVALDLKGSNDTCRAGHCDWRVPLLEELATIVDCTQGDPCIDQTSFGPTDPSVRYWSRTTAEFAPGFAMYIDFGDGSFGSAVKDESYRVRLVRGTSFPVP